MGGEVIAFQFDSLADTMNLSFIKGEFEGDTTFPEFDAGEWGVDSRADHEAFEFVIYRQKK